MLILGLSGLEFLRLSDEILKEKSESVYPM